MHASDNAKYVGLLVIGGAREKKFYSFPDFLKESLKVLPWCVYDSVFWAYKSTTGTTLRICGPMPLIDYVKVLGW